MIGNDIIDLREAEEKSNWQRKGFIKKIFLPEEEKYLINSSNPSLIVWMLWSMKESCFKAYSKNKKISFLPKSYKCLINFYGRHTSGEVEINNTRFISYSLIEKDFISTLVLSDKLKNGRTYCSIIKLTSNNYKIQTSETHSALINFCSEKLKVSRNSLKIKYEEGIPYLFRSNNNINCKISLSHHGVYGAYAIIV